MLYFFMQIDYMALLMRCKIIQVGKMSSWIPPHLLKLKGTTIRPGMPPVNFLFNEVAFGHQQSRCGAFRKCCQAVAQDSVFVIGFEGNQLLRFSCLLSGCSLVVRQCAEQVWVYLWVKLCI